MVHRIVAIVLVFTLLTSNFTKSLALASFALNRKYIAEKLCENRAKPQLGCLGKCFLKKQLKKAEEQEKKDATNSLKKVDDLAVLTSGNQEVRFFCLLSFYQRLSIADLCTIEAPSIFHPPC